MLPNISESEEYDQKKYIHIIAKILYETIPKIHFYINSNGSNTPVDRTQEK